MTGVLALGPSPLSHIGSPLIGTRSCGGHRADHGQKPRAPWVRDKSVQCLNHRARPARPGNANFRPSSDLRNVRFEADEAATRDRDGWFSASPLLGADAQKQTSAVSLLATHFGPSTNPLRVRLAEIDLPLGRVGTGQSVLGAQPHKNLSSPLERYLPVGILRTQLGG